MTKTKKRLLIESKSSTNSTSKSSIDKKKLKSVSHNAKNIKNNATRRKKLLIIETPSENSKEKIEFFLPYAKSDTTKMANPPSGRLNEQFIDIMEQLSNIMLKQGEPFRARAYQKAQETIMSYPSDITSPNDLKNHPGIGPTIMDKLIEYAETGTLRVIEREKTNPVNILAEIYGVGPKKAKELVDAGITTISKLRENQHLLNDIQKVGLKYYEDILNRIPRSEVEQYKTIFENDFKKVSTPNSHFEIVGSFRRGAQNSGDIDMIITSDSPKVFINFVDSLIKKGIILEVLSRGSTKCLVIAKLPSHNIARRVDFLYTSQEEFPFAILYFTGSKVFNTVMRHEALQKGLTMNEHGLYKMEAKKKGDKITHIFKDEKDIFDYLGLEYKSPVERTDGRAIISKISKPKLIIESGSDSEEFVLQPKSTVEKNKKQEGNKNKKPLIIENESYENPENNSDEYIVNIIIDFKKNGISVIQKLNENQLSSIIRYANKAYYNQQPLMTDNEYDIIKDFVENNYPSNKAIVEIGASIERNKAILPYTMGSMDKIKPDTGVLVNWIKQFDGPYVLSCKLDGVSGLYSTEDHVPKLYTRGDGKIGQDVSHLIPHLRLPKTKGIVIRGEFIIPKAVFDSKYKIKFANPRNMVAGIINHKTINEAVKDLHFVAYEVIKPIKKTSDQMTFLSTLDVEVVLYKTATTLSNEILSETLIEWRKNYVYEIDGVIVANDKIYERKVGNPDHAFAFKMVLSDQIAEAKVVDVIWAPSKDGYLKPRVQIEPINLGGVRIEYATGFNGSFINDNKIGVGAVIEIIRSGDVIPYIRKVTSPAQQSKMPSVPFKWNNTKIDVMLEDIESDETVKEKNITGFFKGIGVDGLSTGNVSRIIQAGYTTVPNILKMTVADFLKVDGFKIKTATKLYEGIQEKIDAASLITIMSASNMFGRGFSGKKTELVMESYPNILLSKESDSQKITKISTIKGMADKSAEAFVERIPYFIQFMKDAGLVKKLAQESVSVQKNYDQSHPLFGKSIIMTGFRDNDLQDALKKIGAKLGSSVSKNTFVVLVKDKDEDTGKVSDAKKLGVQLMTPGEFSDKYLK